MSNDDIMLFGGMALGGESPPNATQHQPLYSLNAIDFVITFERWLSTVYPKYSDAPRTAEQLAALDQWLLVLHFRTDYEAGRLVEDRGLSIEEMHLGFQLSAGAPAISLISGRYATQPLGRIPRKELRSSEQTAHQLEEDLARSEKTAVLLLVHDGRFGHSIVAHGADREQHYIRFLDPWPGGTLLAGDQNAAGVAAIPDPTLREGWQIETSQLAKVLVAAIILLPIWDRWQQTSGPISAEQLWRKDLTEGERYLDGSLGTLSSNPGSRRALGAAALALAHVMLERDLRVDALQWLRQAAVAGQQEVMELLHDWDQLRMADEAEANYWGREAASVKAGISPWKLDPADSPEPSTSQQLYQMLPPVTPDLARGYELATRGDLGGARSAYERTIASGHPMASPEAHYNLGKLLHQADQIEAAEGHFLQATLSCHLDLVPWAANELGLLLVQRDNHEGAVAAYERAVYSGHPIASAAAAINLAILYNQSGMVEPALEACDRARVSDIAPYAPQGDCIAGFLLERIGDMTGAVSAYQRAARYGEDQFAQAARAELVRLESKSR
jgi:tetratricopeptide (TPR) repeat protein